MKLNGKVACVTGSVRGIGWEIVQAYAREGAQVVVCDLDQADVDARGRGFLKRSVRVAVAGSSSQMDRHQC